MDAEEWQTRASLLGSDTRLSEREATVIAMEEFAYSRSAIAEELGVAPGTVDEIRHRAEQKIREAIRLLSYLDRGPLLGDDDP